MIEVLYYPKTPYLFNVIEPSVLGKIYESFLTERLIVSDGEVYLAKKNQYKYKFFHSFKTLLWQGQSGSCTTLIL